MSFGRTSLLSLFVLGGCVGEVSEPQGAAAYLLDAGAPQDDAIIRLRLASDPLLDPLRTVEGCMMWRAKGVKCRIVPDGDEADVAIGISDEECVEAKDGSVVLARAFSANRTIVVYRNCVLRGVESRSQAQSDALYAVIIAHEIGHQLGIWEHVPEGCDEPHQTHPVGGPVCGSAVMNPLIDVQLRGFVTGYDMMAFDLREKDMSIVRVQEQSLVIEDGGADGEDGGDCVLRTMM